MFSTLLQMFNRTCSCALLLMMIGASAPQMLHAQSTPLGEVGIVEYSPSPIALTLFERKGSQAYSKEVFSETIQRDLFLSGFFTTIKNTQYVAETQALDKRDGKIHLAEWSRIGADYVAKGSYEIIGTSVEAEIRVWETAGGRYVFGKKFSGFPKEKPQQLAHRISNEIIERITGVPGAAHTMLLYVGETKKGGSVSKEIFLMDADGGSVRQLTADNNLAATPAWGARATEVYFTTYKDYNPDLMGMILSSNYTWFISRRSGFNLSPDWAASHQKIALTLSRDGNSEVYTMNREGKDLKRLTYHASIDSSPAWSPDGSKIAFTSDRNGTPQIYVMDASGVNVQRLSRVGNYSDGAAWSPDGQWVAFASRVNGVFQICVVDKNGDNFRQLSRGHAHCEDPTWSPSGWVLAYTSASTGKKQVHLMFADGRELARLTSGEQSYSPNWSPMID